MYAWCANHMGILLSIEAMTYLNKLAVKPDSGPQRSQLVSSLDGSNRASYVHRICFQDGASGHLKFYSSLWDSGTPNWLKGRTLLSAGGDVDDIHGTSGDRECIISIPIRVRVQLP